MCAQRLTASKESSPGVPGHLLRSSGVLNASRHQRNLHIEPAEKRTPAPRVLNASRHQRNLHRTVRMKPGHQWRAQRLTASKESSPQWKTRLQPHQAVLNASRHQRNLHPRTSPPLPQVAAGAQRLTASKESSRAAEMRCRNGRAGAQRLTASKESSHSSSSSAPASSAGAQRLTASKESSHGRNGQI